MAIFEYPLSWPPEFARTPPHDREKTRFGKRGERGWKTSLTTLQAFDRVLAETSAFTQTGHPWRINPAYIVVSTNIEVRRSDQRPRADRRAPDDPGVAVYLTLDDEAYCLPCDRWTSVAGNLAAIAAHLQAIRGIERWGVGDLRASFKGFQSLPDPNRVIWRDVFGYEPGARPELHDLEARYKRLRSKRHPDRDGNAHEFDRVIKAYQLAVSELGESI